jgi:DUF1680 family protein
VLSRRFVLKSGSAAAVAAALSRKGFGMSAGLVDKPLREMDYSAVTLLPGPLQAQFEYHHRLVLGMDNGTLLKPFRERVGMTAPGEDMGGWYSNSDFFDPHGSWQGFCPGHSFGQYVSALSRAGAQTKDAATRVKVEALIAGIAPTQTETFYAGYPLPAYMFDKICCGLIDAHSYLGVAAAKPLLETTAGVVLPLLPEKALSHAEMRARPHKRDVETWDESYTLPENLFLAYQRMGRNPMFREAGARFLEDDFFDPLAEGVNVLPGEHAYSHVNAFSSAMQAYLTLGSEKHLRAAKNAFKMLEAQSFATGGWGPSETLQKPDTDDVARSLFTTSASFETPCGAYAHFKITRYLLRVTGDAHYGDSMERVLYNTVLGAKPIQADGSAFYYADFSLTGRKVYSRDKWHCCSGTLPQITADYGVSSYLGGVAATETAAASDRGLTVVLFVPSRVAWMEGGSHVTLTQQTMYPAQPSTTLKIEMARDANFPLAVRIPAWSGAGTRVMVNGKHLQTEVVPGRFLRIERTWRHGDRVEVEFEMPLRTEALMTSLEHVTTMAQAPPVAVHPEDAGSPGTVPLAPVPAAPRVTNHPVRLAALMRGPVVFMATGLWPTEMDEEAMLAASIEKSGDRMTVKSRDGRAVTFKPYTAIGDETYRTYQPVQVKL